MAETDVIKGVVVTPLRAIATEGGHVLHGIRNSDNTFAGFGEAYFSEIEPGQVRAWKRHQEMTLNLVAVAGEVRFVLYDNRNTNQVDPVIQVVSLSRGQNYARLTVPPMIWMGMQGVGDGLNLFANIANRPHADTEVDRLPVDALAFEW